jgi:hypothetical protein
MSVIFPPSLVGGLTEGAGVGDGAVECVGLGEGEAEGWPLDGELDGTGDGSRLEGIPDGSSHPVRINKVKAPAAKGLRQSLSMLPAPLAHLFAGFEIDCSLSSVRTAGSLVAEKMRNELKFLCLLSPGVYPLP